MRFFSPPPLIPLLTRSRLNWRVNTQKKILYLSFDDGPNPGITPFVLDTLKEFNARATFFSLGEKIARYPDLFKEVVQQGHAVGNHTYSHLNGWKTSVADYVTDVQRCAHYMQSSLFRPPYGKMTPAQIHALSRQYKIVMWSIMAYDFDNSLKPEKILKVIQRKSRPGSILLLHDSQKAAGLCKTLLPRVLSYFSQQGYAFEALHQKDLK